MGDADFPPYEYDNDLIEAARGDGVPRVRVYRISSPMVVLGSGSRAEVELDLDACRADGIPLLRRIGGGCAVVIDPGNVIVSAVATGLPFGHHQGVFDALTSWLIDGLERIGFAGVRQAGICDLCVGDRKVGGACLHRSRDLLYYSCSLLVDPDMDAVCRYLRHPPREPEYRRGRSHGEFMGSLASSVVARREPRPPGACLPGGCAPGPRPPGGTDAERVAARLFVVLKPPKLEGAL